MEIASAATTLAPVATSVFLEIAKQVFITSMTKKLTVGTTSTATATSAGIPKSALRSTIDNEGDEYVFVNGVRLTEFCHNPKFTVAQETKRVQDYLFRLDWKFTYPFLTKCIAQIETHFANNNSDEGHSAINTNDNSSATRSSAQLTVAQDKNFEQQYKRLRSHDAEITASCQSLLQSLKNTLQAIDVKIQEIYEKIEYNKQKYFGFARTTNYTPYVSELINCCKVFVTRLKMLDDMSRNTDSGRNTDATRITDASRHDTRRTSVVYHQHESENSNVNREL